MFSPPSARINAPKSPKARSSYIPSIIQLGSFVQLPLFTRTIWTIVKVCVPAEPPITFQPHTLITLWFRSILQQPTLPPDPIPLTSVLTGHLSVWHRRSRGGAYIALSSLRVNNRVEKNESCPSLPVEPAVCADVWVWVCHLAHSARRCATVVWNIWLSMSLFHRTTRAAHGQWWK